MKKVFSLVAIAAMTFAVSSCGEGEAVEADTTAQEPQEEVIDEVEEEVIEEEVIEADDLEAEDLEGEAAEGEEATM
jgi:predicted small lipoprotein YifL